jgi:Cof subfamily protein (haloacid dehalogenase superfamily)
MLPKLIATDIDHTFLTDAGHYDHQRFTKIYQQLADRNIRFVIASGNQKYHLTNLFPDYPDLIYVAENGAYVSDRTQAYALTTFSDDVASEVISRLTADSKYHFSMCNPEMAFIRKTEPEPVLATARKFCDRLTLVDDLQDSAQHIVKFTLNAPADELAALYDDVKQLLGPLVAPMTSGHTSIDLVYPGVNKATGLQTLGDKLGISTAEMWAFGDDRNDVPMLAEVGRGIAVANAVPAVQAVSDDTAPAANEQGVLQYLEQALATEK